MPKCHFPFIYLDERFYRCTKKPFALAIGAELPQTSTVITNGLPVNPTIGGVRFLHLLPVWYCKFNICWT